MGPRCAQAALSRRLSAAAADKTKEETQQQPTAVPLTRTTFHRDTPLPAYQAAAAAPVVIAGRASYPSFRAPQK